MFLIEQSFDNPAAAKLNMLCKHHLKRERRKKGWKIVRSIPNWQQILNGSFFSPSAVSMLLDEYQLYWFRRCYQSTEFAYFDKGKKKKKNTKRRTFWSKTPRHSCLASLSISCRLCFESFPISIGDRYVCVSLSASEMVKLIIILNADYISTT